MSIYDARYYRGSKKFQKGEKRLKELSDIIMSYKPRSVLDVGCGLGFLVKHLRSLGVTAVGVDSAQALKDFFWGDSKEFIIADATKLPFFNRSFDLVFSSDFFEHLPEESIDGVAAEMKRVGKTILARVANEDKLTRRQALYHLTNKPEAWWREKLQGIILV